MDEQIPWMNHVIWADEINNFQARNLRSRYRAEITYIDDCIGKILDAVEKRPDAGQHPHRLLRRPRRPFREITKRAGRRRSHSEQSARIPFLLSWPAKYPGGTTCHDLVCLTDLFGVATAASGEEELRGRRQRAGPPEWNRPAQRGPVRLLRPAGHPAVQGHGAQGRLEIHLPFQRRPGAAVQPEGRSRRKPAWKIRPSRKFSRKCGICWRTGCIAPGCRRVLDANGKPICHEFKARPKFRIRQFDASSGVKEIHPPGGGKDGLRRER